MASVVWTEKVSCDGWQRGERACGSVCLGLRVCGLLLGVGEGGVLFVFLWLGVSASVGCGWQ